MSDQTDFQDVAEAVISGVKSISELKQAGRVYIALTKDWRTVEDAFVDAGAANSTIREFLVEEGCVAGY